jgi:hypothetical protein
LAWGKGSQSAPVARRARPIGAALPWALTGEDTKGEGGRAWERKRRREDQRLLTYDRARPRKVRRVDHERMGGQHRAPGWGGSLGCSKSVSCDAELAVLTVREGGDDGWDPRGGLPSAERCGAGRSDGPRSTGARGPHADGGPRRGGERGGGRVGLGREGKKTCFPFLTLFHFPCYFSFEHKNKSVPKSNLISTNLCTKQKIEFRVQHDATLHIPLGFNVLEH